MDITDILIGKSGVLDEHLLLRQANRHGLIAGATGTGKTVTLQTLAESFARAGVPVFAADIKGDLSGISRPGTIDSKLAVRAREMAIPGWAPAAVPALHWDVFGEQGHPVRTTIAEMGPLLLARLLDLNDVQEGVLNIVFRLADEQSMLLLDLADLRAMLASVAERADELRATYGNVSSASVGAVQRALLVIEQQGGGRFFGEPALKLEDLMRVAPDGQGYVNLLAADKLLQSPRLYTTFLLWLLSELFEELPEAGDLDKPKLVFFFDEAHLLFDGAPKVLVDKIEQVVRLIRSKGVGIYFVTQNPLDVPDEVLGQLGNRVQHALRAFTPRDQKAVRTAAETFRPNPDLDTAKVITELGVGEALVSVLDDKGVPTPVQRCKIAPPRSRVGPLTSAERAQELAASPVAKVYDTPIDRESAAEMLAARATGAPPPPPANLPPGIDPALAARLDAAIGSIAPSAPGAGTSYPPPQAKAGRAARTVAPAREKPSVAEQIAMSVAKNAASSIARSVGSRVGSALVRGVLGSLLK
ncbi:MAG TPA: helicase HerA-like domain-containing protein [Geminicoccus sp.]|nr:helicase HerA-like domain-containing protein [Geminicoccus sp.]HEX2527735.1 helicase HerA-like domain-containing protein [Geminicoccus sp.]